MSDALKEAAKELLFALDDMFYESEDKEHYYGPFSEHRLVYYVGYDAAIVSWPNLKIFAERLRALLPGHPTGGPPNGAAFKDPMSKSAKELVLSEALQKIHNMTVGYAHSELADKVRRTARIALDKVRSPEAS